MSGAYLDAMRDGLAGVLNLLLRVALPLSIFLGLLLAAIIVAGSLKGSALVIEWSSIRRAASRVFAFAGVGLIVVCLWSGLKQVQPAARESIDWKESAEASDTPAPDAPPINQYGPVAAMMVERTYEKSLTLPAEFVQRIGTDGLGVLSQYLVDPTAEKILKQVDSFKRMGQDVLFSRQVTRQSEVPLAFDSSDVKVVFHRLQEQAYDVDFSATYTFTNSTEAPVNARFLFSPPEGGTVQDLKVEIDGKDIAESGNGASQGRPTEPGPAMEIEPPPGSGMDARSLPLGGPPMGSGSDGVGEWTGTLNPGETRKATVRYKVVGADGWSYDLGSSRRRVKAFNLQATVDGPFQFTKGGIQPSSRSGNTITWKLADVVTSQQLSLTFPPDVRLRESYLQALAALPATLVLFGLCVLLVGWRLGAVIQPSQLALGLLAFGFGLGATVVVANYLGPIVAVFVGPMAGAALAGGVYGWRSLVAILPVVLFPAASLSPHNTGFWVLALAALGLVAYALLPRFVAGQDRPVVLKSG